MTGQENIYSHLVTHSTSAGLMTYSVRAVLSAKSCDEKVNALPSLLSKACGEKQPQIVLGDASLSDQFHL